MVNFIKAYAKLSIERPSLGRSFIFFLLPFILSVVIAAFIGVSVNFSTSAFNVFLELINWFVSAFFLFAIVHLVRGKIASGKFKGVMAALGFRYFFIFLLMAFVFLVLFVVVPEFFPLIAQAQRAATADQAFEMLATGLSSIEAKNGLVLLGGFSIIILATLLAFLLVLYLEYEIVAFTGEGSARQNLLMLFLWVILQAIIMLFVL